MAVITVDTGRLAGIPAKQDRIRRWRGHRMNGAGSDPRSGSRLRGEMHHPHGLNEEYDT